MLERYMKEAKKLEQEEESRKKSLEKDLKSTQTRQLTNLQKDHKRRRKTLRKEAGKNIDGYREFADQMEQELKELETKLQTEASSKRTSLQEEVLTAKAHKFERILKRKLALEVAVYEELHAVQYSEMKHYNSMELATLELRHASELGKDLRAQAESENCDGNPTISHDLAERQRKEHTDMTAAHATRLKALADHHNQLLDNLFTVYHAELAAVRESAASVNKDWSKRVPLEAFGPEPTEGLPPHLVTMTRQPGQWGGLEENTLEGATATATTNGWEEKASRKGSDRSLMREQNEEILRDDIQPIASHQVKPQPTLIRAATMQSTARPGSMYDYEPIEDPQPAQIKRTASLDTAKPASANPPAPVATTTAVKKPPPTVTTPYKAPPPETRNPPATLPKPAKQPAPETVAPVAKAAEATTQSKVVPAPVSQSKPLDQVKSTTSQPTVAAQPPPAPPAQSKPVFVPVTQPKPAPAQTPAPATQPKPILAPAPAPTPTTQSKPTLTPAPALAAQSKPTLAPVRELTPAVQSKPILAPAPAPAPAPATQSKPVLAPAPVTPAAQSQPPPRPTALPPMKQQEPPKQTALISFNTPIPKSKGSSNFNTWGEPKNPYKEAWMAPLPPHTDQSDIAEGFLASASVRDADASDVEVVRAQPIENVPVETAAPAKKPGMLASVFAKGMGGKKVLPPHPSFYKQHPPPSKEQKSFQV